MFITSKSKPVIIKVIGVGGVGSKTVREMESAGKFPDIGFIALQPKSDTLSNNDSVPTVQLSSRTDIPYSRNAESYKRWEEIALANRESIKQCIHDADIVFISCNEGRGFGTGVSPVVADIAHESGALVIAVVTIPFALEGRGKMEIAEEGTQLLKEKADTVIIVHKQRIFEHIAKKTLFTEAYSQIKTPLYQSVRIISDIIRLTKLINIDLADLKLIMGNAGLGFIGEGEGAGKSSERVQQAIDDALSFPLTNNSIQDAKNLLLHITGGTDLSMGEVEELCSIAAKSVYSQANIKYGLTIDEKTNGKIKVSIVATSLDNGISPFNQQYPATIDPDENQLPNFEIPTFVRNGNSTLNIS